MLLVCLEFQIIWFVISTPMFFIEISVAYPRPLGPCFSALPRLVDIIALATEAAR